MKIIAKILKTDIDKESKVTKIDLSFNKITDQGAEKISKILNNNDNITHIDLSDNNISNKGRAFARN